MHYLLEFRDNYADEFDISGFRLVWSDDIEALEALIEKEILAWEAEQLQNEWNKSERFTWYFGTNEGIDYSLRTYPRTDIKTLDKVNLRSAYVATELSDIEAEVIATCLGTSFGFTGPLEFYKDTDEEE